MALGETRHIWVPDVRANIHKVLSRYPQLSANTYVGHPWPGWMRWSVDFWGNEGRGHAAPLEASRAARQFLMSLPGRPFIRHTILEHQLWTSWGGYSYWAPDDHDGHLQHLHVTYWRY